MINQNTFFRKGNFQQLQNKLSVECYCFIRAKVRKIRASEFLWRLTDIEDVRAETCLAIKFDPADTCKSCRNILDVQEGKDVQRCDVCGIC